MSLAAIETLKPALGNDVSLFIKVDVASLRDRERALSKSI
jgi:hypothetical protein